MNNQMMKGMERYWKWMMTFSMDIIGVRISHDEDEEVDEEEAVERF